MLCTLCTLICYIVLDSGRFYIYFSFGTASSQILSQKKFCEFRKFGEDWRRKLKSGRFATITVATKYAEAREYQRYQP